MTKQDYLLYSIKQGYLDVLAWYYTTVAILAKPIYKNEYIEIVNKTIYVLIDGERVLIDDLKYGEPIFKITDVYTLPKNTLSNNDTMTITTFGYVVLNYLLVASVFKNKIKYINDDFDIKKLENRLSKLLIDDVITVKEFKQWMNHCMFTESLSRITTVSATEKTVTIPKGLLEYKKKLTKEYDDKYGVDTWRDNQVYISEYEDKLKAYYNDWVKDDPSNNIFLSGKIKGNSVLLRYLSIGTPPKLGVAGENTKHIKNSLVENMTTDKDELASMFNVPISASYSRGKSTADGGTVSKQLLRSTSSIKITKNDCGVTYGKTMKVMDDNIESLVYRYMIVNKKPVLIKSVDDIKKYLNKTIELRSPAYCKEKETDFCGVCSGEMMAMDGHRNSVSLLVTSISAVLLTSSLKKMHSSQINVMDTDINDMII